MHSPGRPGAGRQDWRRAHSTRFRTVLASHSVTRKTDPGSPFGNVFSLSVCEPPGSRDRKGGRMRLRWARGGTPSLRTRLLAGVMIPSTLVLVVGGVVGVRLVTDAVAVDRLSDANSAET